ncbi:hypothetical protein F4776DRAFT_280940 [Hypoxylon sp. NC0597]|nr:hypothetical protein F4776DRAFT_280940 [Hypoxylon sp. NC0597]
MSGHSSTTVYGGSRLDEHHSTTSPATPSSSPKLSRSFKSACLVFVIFAFASACLITILFWFLTGDKQLLGLMLAFFCASLVSWIIWQNKFSKDGKRRRREDWSRGYRAPMRDEENAIPLQLLRPVRIPERARVDEDKM